MIYRELTSISPFDLEPKTLAFRKEDLGILTKSFKSDQIKSLGLPLLGTNVSSLSHGHTVSKSAKIFSSGGGAIIYHVHRDRGYIKDGLIG